MRYRLAALLFALAGWGEDGHRIIADAAWPRLPAGVRRAFGEDRAAFERACIEPDSRKHVETGEGARHYVDIERWSDEFLALARRARGKDELARLYQPSWPPGPDEVARRYAQVPARRADYERWRGAVPDDDLGTIFYAIDAETEALRAALASGDGAAAARAAGDLCHYLGDLVQPLHNTANYRGQLSGNAICRHSVHERYESAMVHKFRVELARRVAAQLARARASPEPAEPVALALAASRRAYARLPSILSADRALLRDQAACERARPAAVAAGLYRATGRLTAEQMAEGAALLATLAARASGQARDAKRCGSLSD